MDIEEILEARLFNRLSRGMRPNELGLFTLRYASAALDGQRKFVDEFNALKQGGASGPATAKALSGSKFDLGGYTLDFTSSKRTGSTFVDFAMIGDNDPPRQRPGGGWWQPGLEGAVKLARHCHLPGKIVVPPVKDLREWVGAGLTASHFNHITAQQKEKTHGW